MPIDYSRFDNIDITDDEEAESSTTKQNDRQVSCSTSTAATEKAEEDASKDQFNRIHMSSALLAENFSKNVAYCERNMWQLSTLGGAYASMSFYAKQWAEMLLNVSIKQFKLSKQLNNEAYISRARIYIAHALATNDDFEQALLLIRRELRYIKYYLKDDFNMRVATAIHTRIKHLQEKAITSS